MFDSCLCLDDLTDKLKIPYSALSSFIQDILIFLGQVF